jgi:DNA replication protein DnaC
MKEDDLNQKEAAGRKSLSEQKNLQNESMPSKSVERIDPVIAELVSRCKEAAQRARERGILVFPDVTDDRQNNSAKPNGIFSRLKRGGVEEKEICCRFDTYKGNQKVIDLVKEVGDGENLVLSGPSGCGKTHLAIAIMADYAERHPDDEIVFVGVPIMMSNIRSTFDDRTAMTEKELLDYYCSVPLLILDDLGSEHNTDYAVTTLFAIIYQRNRKSCKTVVTTNLTIEDLGKHLRSLGLESRLASWETIEIKSMPDYRQQQKRMRDEMRNRKKVQIMK